MTCSSTFSRAAVVTFFQSLGETGLLTALMVRSFFPLENTQYGILVRDVYVIVMMQILRSSHKRIQYAEFMNKSVIYHVQT
jgi:hypothetical protein